MKMLCDGSDGRETITLAQTHTTAGYVRPNKATDVRCRKCGKRFATTRIAYTDHGIPLAYPAAVIPRHNVEREAG